MNAPATVDHLRYLMIEQQIRPWNVLDRDVLDLLGTIRREDFVPPAHRALAFFDMEIPLKDGSDPGQVMLPPKIEAKFFHDLQIKPHETVLEIGTGSGFMAALLALKAKHVLTLEIDSELATRATETLRTNGVQNVEVRHADGSQPLPNGPTFDVIVLSGSVAQLPQNLLGSLNKGGRLVAIVGDEPVMRTHIVTRLSESNWHTAEPWDTVAPRLRNFPEVDRFNF